jgi:UPF0716 protein FxsA
LRQGKLPTNALVDGALILIAGVLLITPGVLTDVMAFALLVPPLRRAVKWGVVAWLRRNVEVHAAQFTYGDRTDTVGRGRSRTEAPSHAEIIDARVIETHVEDAH